jgi:hypothetical protein
MHKIDDTDKKLIKNLAEKFATALWAEVGTLALIKIDQDNRTANPGVCASHDFTDANVVMHKVLVDSGIGEGIGEAANQPLRRQMFEFWDNVWTYAKTVGFCRLRGIRGHGSFDFRDNGVTVEHVDSELRIIQPTHTDPVVVAVDYWGNNPRLQVMVYEAAGSDEPVVKIRFTPDGKVQELMVDQKSAVGGARTYFDDRPDTPWALERDDSPACRAGDLLLMPSGQFGEVMRLRKRYANYDEYVHYDSIYQVARRLNNSAGSNVDFGEGALEILWAANPLTVATTDPTDLSIVPEDRTELPDPEQVLNLVRK